MGSLLLLSIYLSTSLSHYIYTPLSAKLPKPVNQTSSMAGSRPLPTTWLMEPCHNGERWSPCRGVALCAQISSPQCPQSVFHQNKAILNFYCINWILKDRSTKNGNSVSIYTLTLFQPVLLFCTVEHKRSYSKKQCSFGPHWLALNGQKQLKYLPNYILFLFHRSQGWNNELGCKCELSYVNVPIMMSQSV